MKSARWLAALAVGLAVAWTAPARAAVTVYEGDKGKLDMEFRLMAWVVEAGPDLVPTGTGAPPAQEGDITDFMIRRARVVIRAQISKSLDLYLQAGQDNIGSKIARDDSGFRIKDAAINWKHGEALQLAVGQFKVPFLRQNLESGFNQLLVDRSLVTAIRPATEGQRDQGGAIWGNHGGLQYRVAVFDGSDQEDTSSRSRLRGTARVSWNWFTLEPGPGYTGTTLGQKKVLQVGGQVDTQDGRVDPRDAAGFETAPRNYRAWAGDVFYEQPLAGGWAVVGEGAWSRRRDDYLDDALATRVIDAWYAQAGCLLPFAVGPGRLQIVGRYERFDSRRGDATSGVHGRTFGVNWFVKDHNRKIQFDHVTLHEHPVDLDNDAYRLSFVAVF